MAHAQQPERDGRDSARGATYDPRMTPDSKPREPDDLTRTSPQVLKMTIAPADPVELSGAARACA